MSQDYEALYQQTLSNLPDLNQEIVDTGSVSVFTQKLVNTTRSVEEKMSIVQQNMLDKELDIEGFQRGLLYLVDADSGYIENPVTKQRTQVRLSDLNPIDATDSLGANKSSVSRVLQAKQVADLVGKPVDQLTAEDYQNVKNYQYQQVLGQFQNKDYQFSPYDRATQYENLEAQPLPVAFKATGVDAYGRALVEAINPTSGRRVSFDMSNNPYLNSRFDVYKSIGSVPNERRLEAYQRQHNNYLQRISDVYDTDGRLGEDIDTIQSTAYQTAARLLQYGPDFLVDSEKWAKIANAETGQALANAWASVKTSTRRDFANEMLAASDAWDNGDYTTAILGWATQMDRLFSESAIQMGLMTAGTLATGGIGAGAGIAARIGGAFLGASLAGVDKTLQTIEEFKINNDGQEMSAEEIAQAFALNTATLIPESFLVGINFARFLPKPVAGSLVKAYQSSAITSRLGTVAMSALGEAGQEGLEGAVERYLSQNQKDAKSFTSYLFSNDTVKEAVIGGIMGGTLSGIAATATAPIAIRRENRTNAWVNSTREQNKTLTNTGNEANQEQSAAIQSAVSKISVSNFNNASEVETAIKNLDALAAAPNISRETVEVIGAKKAELVKQAVLQAKDDANLSSILQALGKTKEEVFQEQVFFSDLNAPNQLLRDGKRLTDESRQAVQQELTEFGNKLGLSKDQITKSINQVKDETRFGWKGYNTFNDQIKAITTLLQDNSLSSEERAKLESNRTGYAFRLTQLYNNQLNKLVQFAENAEKIASGKVRESRFTYKSKEGSFNLIGEHLANYTYDSGYSAYGVVQNLERDISDMANMIKSLPKEVIADLSKSYGSTFNLQTKTVQDSLQRFKDAATNIREGVKQQVKEQATTEVEGKVQSKFSDKELLAKVSALAKGMSNAKAKTKFIGELRNVSDEQLTKLRDEISNSNLTDATKQSMLEVLDNIHKIETTTQKERSDMDVRTKEVLKKAEDFLSEVTDQVLDSLDTIEDVKDLMEEIRNIFNPIAGNKDNSELTEFYRERYSKLQEKLRKLEAEDNAQPVVSSTSEFASNTLLDTTTNSSATYAPSGWGTFNIKNELKLSRNPGSKIATEGAEQSYINDVLAKMKSLFLTLELDNKGKPISSKIAFFTKTNGKADGGMWKDSPHLRLLYNFVVNGSDIVFNPNNNVVAAIDLSIKEFFSSMNVKDTFNPRTRYDVASLYGYNEATMTDEQYEQLLATVKEYGIPKAIIAQRIGDLILDNLGLRVNIKNGTKGYFERTSMGMGLFALSYAQELGYVTERTFESTKWSEDYKAKTGEDKKHAVSFDTPHIKFNKGQMSGILNEFLGTKNEEGVRTGGLKDRYKLTNSLEAKPRTSITQMPRDMKIRGTMNLMDVPAFTKKVMNKLWKTPYQVNLELAELVAKNKKAIAARLGYVDDLENQGLIFDERTSYEGINYSVETEIKHLLEAAAYQQKKSNKWYYNWFMSKNGRLFIDSTHINSQASKALQRFLILPESMYRDFDPTNESHMQSMYFAIAQAFDSVGNDESIETLGKTLQNLSIEEINKLQEDLINLDEKAFKKEYKKLGIDGIENFGHALNVIQHLQKMKEADGKPFKTWLAVENDSTTSGYFIRFLQFPDPNIIENFGEKVGILTADSKLPQTEIHNLKKQKGFLDIYKTMAKNASESLVSIIKNPLAAYSNSKYNPNELVSTFRLMEDALPKPNEDGSIGPDLRKLLKSPAMTFGYTAGQKSISQNLSMEIMRSFLNTYALIKKEGSLEAYLTSLGNIDIADKSKITAIYNTMEHINKFYKGDLYSALLNNSAANIWLKIDGKNITLDRFFNEVLAPTYGQAVWSSLEESFKSYIKYNNSMNHMFIHMFQLFEAELDKKIEALKKIYPNGIPILEEQNAVKELFDIFPALRLAYSESMNEGMLLMNTDKARDDTSTVLSPINREGKTERDTSYANVHKFINSGKAGAVLPIHFLDGMGMAMVLNKYSGVVPVHDAIVMSALDNQAITQEYNQVMYTLNKSYDVYGELVNRYLDVIKHYQEMTGSSAILDEQMVDAYGNKLERNKEPFTVQQLINEVLELDGQNQQFRERFFDPSNPLYISNMDGIQGSGVLTNNETLEDRAFKDAIATWRGYSDPNIYRTDNDIKHVLQEATDSVEGRVKVFDALQQLAKDLGNKVENQAHLQYLKDLIRKVNPKYLQDLIVEYSTSQDYNVGMLLDNTITIGFDSKVNLDSVTRLSPYSGKSAAEIYAHEIVHAGLRVGFANKDAFKLNKEIQQLLNLQRSAMDIVTWHDFMPDNYDSKLQSVYEANAKQIWDYIFNNPNVKELQGLHEFTAYGLTNEKVMNKLKNNFVVESNQKVKLLDKLIALAKDILDVVFGRTNLRTLLGTVSSKHRNTLFRELELLTNKINYANTDAGNSLFHHPMKMVEHLFKLIGQLRVKGNEIVSPKLQYLTNIVDNLGYAQGWSAKIHGSWFDDTKLLANLLLLTPFSKSRRQALNIWMKDVLQLSQQGIIQTVLREVQEPDLQTSRLAMVSALTRTVDQTSKALEATVYAELVERFGKKKANDFRKEETAAITQSVLFTDLQSLLDDNTSIENIKKILSSPEELNSRVEELETKLDKTGHGLWYKNQALGLALYMTTGVGNEIQNLNAQNIAEGRMTGSIITPTNETIENIDKLTTLYALRMIDNDTKAIVANLNSVGLQNYLVTHKQFIKDTVEGVEIDGKVVKTVNNIHTIKGYTKQLLDTTLDVKVDMKSKQTELAKEGYKLVKELGVNEITGVAELGLYKRNFATPNRRDGAGFIMTGANTIGTTLKESAYQTYENIDPDANFEQVRALQQQYYKNAEKVSQTLLHMMQNEVITPQKIKRFSKGYTPIISPNGGIADFRITMAHTTKMEHLGMNLDGLKILSKMYASQNTKLNASTRNKILVDFLRNDMEINMNSVSKQDTEGHKYILLHKGTDNQFLRDAWNTIPKELMTEINKGDFYVREDWLQDLFGVPSTSLNELKWIKNSNKLVLKRALAVGEYVMKAIAYMAKQNIVIRVPAVLIGNILSNINYSVAMGTNPATVFKKTFDNSQSIRDYIDNKKELNRILFRQKLGTATQYELKQINWYNSKLESNPVHPLMQKGMYQAIVEDINPDELEAVGKVSRFIKESKIAQKVPTPIKWISKQLYMTEGTPFFDFMFTATQYSDFVARATEYQLRMANAPKQFEIVVDENGKKVKKTTDAYLKYEEAVTIDIWNAFINYDKPQSSLEQYLNDIGLLMFTKYAKRIQHMITKGIINNPIGVLMFTMYQSAILNTDDIYEQNIFNKSWSSLIHNPIENFVNAATPMPLQYYFGMRNLGI